MPEARLQRTRDNYKDVKQCKCGEWIHPQSTADGQLRQWCGVDGTTHMCPAYIEGISHLLFGGEVPYGLHVTPKPSSNS